MEIKLWGENERDGEVAGGEVGELGVRGASLMLGWLELFQERAKKGRK